MEKAEESTPGHKKKHAGKTKATAMSRAEMVELVRSFETYDYDGKLKNYNKPNARKDRILDKVIEDINKKHGILRSKDQLRKRWSDLKHREHAQLQKIHQIINKSTILL